MYAECSPNARQMLATTASQAGTPGIYGLSIYRLQGLPSSSFSLIYLGYNGMSYNGTTYNIGGLIYYGPSYNGLSYNGLSYNALSYNGVVQEQHHWMHIVSTFNFNTIRSLQYIQQYIQLANNGYPFFLSEFLQYFYTPWFPALVCQERKLCYSQGGSVTLRFEKPLLSGLSCILRVCGTSGECSRNLSLRPLKRGR